MDSIGSPGQTFNGWLSTIHGRRGPLGGALKPPDRRSIPPGEMFIGLVLLLCLATVPLARGRLGALADVRFRVSWLALVAIAGQIVVVSLLP